MYHGRNWVAHFRLEGILTTIVSKHYYEIHNHPRKPKLGVVTTTAYHSACKDMMKVTLTCIDLRREASHQVAHSFDVATPREHMTNQPCYYQKPIRAYPTWISTKLPKPHSGRPKQTPANFARQTKAHDKQARCPRFSCTLAHSLKRVMVSLIFILRQGPCLLSCGGVSCFPSFNPSALAIQ